VKPRWANDAAHQWSLISALAEIIAVVLWCVLFRLRQDGGTTRGGNVNVNVNVNVSAR
jgi:hypothetical protein